MDFEFSNKERAKSFPIEMSPWIFHSGIWQMLELHCISKGLWWCFFFFFLWRKTLSQRLTLREAFTDKRVIQGRGIYGNQVVNFCFQQSHRKKYKWAWKNICPSLLKASKKICLKRAFKWEGYRCFQSSSSLQAGLGQTWAYSIM